MINYGKQWIDYNDTEAVSNVMNSDFLTQGTKVLQFEEQMCEYTGYKYAVAMSSGTAALHSAISSLNLEKGSEIIVPGLSFLATANCVKYCDCVPVFADVDIDTLLIDIDNIEKLITKKTKAVIAMDYAGQMCNYIKLNELCNKHNIKLISDACHSVGALTSHCNEKEYSHITCYSFHPVKNITTGEGGMCLTNDFETYLYVKAFINHGRYDGFTQVILGYNYRMNEMQAALGITQLKKIGLFLNRREEQAQEYRRKLPKEILLKKENNHAYHLFVIKIKNRQEFIEYMKTNNINCGIHYRPIYENEYYSEYADQARENCKNTELIKNIIVTIPLFVGLKFYLRDGIADSINLFLGRQEDEN
jgi:perosamine synthetase